MLARHCSRPPCFFWPVARVRSIVRRNLMLTLMRYQKLFVVVGMLGIATIMRAQQSPSPTPFIADPTQAETPRSKAAPTAVPNTSYSVNPIAPPSRKAGEAPQNEPGVARAEPVSEREVITR